MAISFIVTNAGTINAVAAGKAFTIPRDHPNYDAIKKAIGKGDEQALSQLADIPKAINTFTGNTTKVENGQVYWKGQALNNNLTERILGLMRDGFPFQPMLKFLENLMENPSCHSVNELYKFLEHRGLPITEDGCFLGYKAVRDDYTDKHSGKFDNHVGQVLSIPRNTVDDDWRLDCSSGFHVGCLEYVRGFIRVNDADHCMIVKVNPKDVVSVPPNEVTKLRTCAYEVVGEYDVVKLMDSVYMPDRLHTAAGVEAQASGGMGGFSYQNDEPDEDDDDYEEEDVYEDEDDEEDDDTY